MRSRILHTSGFQIAILYLALFSLTLFAAIGFVYWSTSRVIERQTNETIAAEIRGLAEQYRGEGLPRLVEIVRERSGPNGNPQNVYLLTDPLMRPLAGNLASWPGGEADEKGRLELRLERAGDRAGREHLVVGRQFELDGGFRLFVGRDTVERGDFRRILATAIAWAVGPALLLGLIGSFLIGRYSLRRVEAVREAGEDIVKGDLTRRVPLTGSGDEFDRLAQAINEMLERIETLMSGMRLVTDSLAHDLRSPLSRARNVIDDALREDRDEESLKAALEETMAELDTILKTFDSLINIARAEAGIGGMDLSELDLSALALDLYEVYQPIAEEAGLVLESDIPTAVKVRGHRQVLGQAIANLLENAVKYTPKGGRIALRVAAEDNRARLAVADTGPGIPPGERGRVQERFVRLDGSRGTSGSGLGLSLVAAAAKLHGARLELEDNSPGLCATLVFPDRA